MKRRIAILGSTGSIGRSAVDVVRQFPDRFEVVALTGHSNTKLLEEQAELLKPRFVVASGPSKEVTVPQKTELLRGASSLEEVAAHPDVDLVLAAIVGIAGLAPVYAALKARKTVLLANKESLVCGGGLVTDAAAEFGGSIVPVDSEHSAIFQLLEGGRRAELKEVVLTASGGPFLNRSLESFDSITPEEAVKHPRWKMGAKISVDSATLMNKALEVIEAHWLFSLKPERIKVLIHPESIIHSLVEFIDGVQYAHLSVPDMKAAISYALSYPCGRLHNVVQRLDLSEVGSLHFQKPDSRRFPSLSLAESCLIAGGSASAVLSIANEIAVDRFLRGDLSFQNIVPFNEKAVERFGSVVFNEIRDVIELSEELWAVYN